LSESFIDIAVRWAEQVFVPLGPLGLFALAFAESSFFPVPPDVILIPLALINPANALFYGFLATAGSVCGALFGYWIGLKGGRPVILKFASERRVSQVESYFNKYGLWAVGLAAFTPIPYKVFTIASGAFRVKNVKGFIMVSFIGRGARFITEALLVMLYGEAILGIMRQYFEQLTVAIAAIAIVAYIVYRKWKKM